jgi:uncharacterized protein
VAIVFVASLIRSTFGFGEALVAVPLLALFMPIEIAAPLAVLLSITIALIVVLQDREHVEVRTAGWLVAPTLGGIPLGVLLLTRVNEHVVKALLGIVILAFCFYLLWGRALPEMHGHPRGWLLACGFAAGVLGGAYGMNGPPLVIYGAMRRWTAQAFRATLQGYFLAASITGMAAYWYEGLWVPRVTHLFWISLPAAVAATLLGRAINRRLAGETFLKCVYVGLAGTAVVLLVQAAR